MFGTGYSYRNKRTLLVEFIYTYSFILIFPSSAGENTNTNVETWGNKDAGIFENYIHSEEDLSEELPFKDIEDDIDSIDNNYYAEEETIKKIDEEVNCQEAKLDDRDVRTFRENGNCNLPEALIREIKSYQKIANKIMSTVVNGSFKGRTYNELAHFVDKFGSRQFGTENLESSINFMIRKLRQEGFENVHGEKATIPRWVRGKESATLIYPRKKKLSLLGLGFSVGTHPEGLLAEVLVVRTFEELRRKANQAKGKIVVINKEWEPYPPEVSYNRFGSSEVAKVGGVAVLIRSYTPLSINSPHTGLGRGIYDETPSEIPAASITVEDAQLLNRIQCRGEKMVIELKLADFNLPLTTSRNVIAEIKGREKPDEVVVISGHIDSWDIGEGAMDDGGGVFVSVETLTLLKSLKLTPRRTLRTILWTAEEAGFWGVRGYVDKHRGDLDKFNVVFESDFGTSRPLGLDYTGNDNAGCIVEEVLKLLAPINATLFRSGPSVGTDVVVFIEQGVPGVNLNTANTPDNERYFYFHHTEGDTMTVENSDELDLCTALWAVSSYVLADLSVSLPRS